MPDDYVRFGVSFLDGEAPELLKRLWLLEKAHKLTEERHQQEIDDLWARLKAQDAYHKNSIKILGLKLNEIEAQIETLGNAFRSRGGDVYGTIDAHRREIKDLGDRVTALEPGSAGPKQAHDRARERALVNAIEAAKRIDDGGDEVISDHLGMLRSQLNYELNHVRGELLGGHEGTHPTTET